MSTASEKLKTLIESSNNLVFFGGAGVSTESGIPDFRSKGGLYNQVYDFPPEEILSHHFFFDNPPEFFRFYFDRVIAQEAKPNNAHKALANLEKRGILKAVATQNIDGLHQAAGSKNVLELHGSVHRNYCVVCGATYSLEDILGRGGVPLCSCGGMIRPDVVLYEEALDPEVMDRSIEAIKAADTLIIGGTSMQVYPAADMVRYFEGDNLIIINKDPSPVDMYASLVINAPIGETLTPFV